MLAAYHSQARHSTNVPVDYTQRQNVWKPQGAKPGFVLYAKQHTIYVTPDPEDVKGVCQGDGVVDTLLCFND
jgi:predicted ribosome quality control (RQC) complex YloA/Tae2 family protein